MLRLQLIWFDSATSLFWYLIHSLGMWFHKSTRNFLTKKITIVNLTSLIAVISAWAVGSAFLTTMLWQLESISSFRTITAPNGRPWPLSTALYASSIAIVRNLFSLSSAAGITRENNTNKVIYRRKCLELSNHSSLRKFIMFNNENGFYGG